MSRTNLDDQKSMKMTTMNKTNILVKFRVHSLLHSQSHLNIMANAHQSGVEDEQQQQPLDHYEGNSEDAAMR